MVKNIILNKNLKIPHKKHQLMINHMMHHKKGKVKRKKRKMKEKKEKKEKRKKEKKNNKKVNLLQNHLLKLVRKVMNL